MTYNQKVNQHPFRDRQGGLIYFITCEHGDFPIKIGYAADLEARMPNIQTYLPFPVVVLATTPGTPRMERTFHRQFAKQRMKGEWFARTPALLNFIKALTVNPEVWRSRPKPNQWHTREDIERHVIENRRSMEREQSSDGTAMWTMTGERLQHLQTIPRIQHHTAV